jgi:DNA-binding MarR family transcriptional regulator
MGSREVASLVPDLYRIARRLRRMTGPHHLDIATLMLLHRLACVGASRPSDLATELDLDLSTVSRHVRALTEAGLVERDPDPDDGRSFRMTLTTAGAEEMTDAFRRREDAVAAATRRWDPQDVDDLKRLLGRLADELDAADTPHQAAGSQETR